MLPPLLQGLWLQPEATVTGLVLGDELQEARMSWLVAGAAPRRAVVEGQLRPFHNGSQGLSSQLALPRALWATGAPSPAR